MTVGGENVFGRPGKVSQAGDNMSSDVRLAFVVGTGRCGSTLVHEVICRHSRVGFISNIDDKFPTLNLKGRFNSAVYTHLPTAVTGQTASGTLPGWGGNPPQNRHRRPLLVQRINRPHFSPSEGWKLIEARASKRVSKPTQDLTEKDARSEAGEAYRGLVVERSRAQAPRLLTLHFTGWPRVRFVATLFPTSRFVHIVRDGRAVAASMTRMSWWTGQHGPPTWGTSSIPDEYLAEWRASSDNPALFAAIQWKTLIDAFLEARRHVPVTNWLEVRYEDIVADPRQSFQEILEFLGLQWEPDFERRFRRLAFSAVRTSSCASELSASDQTLLNRSLESHLLQLGYSLG